MGVMDGSMNWTEARRLCDRYQYLTGRELGRPWGKVHKVVVSPWDEINKHIFFQQYKRTFCEVAALSFYQVPFFDVSIILKEEDRWHMTDLPTIIALCEGEEKP